MPPRSTGLSGPEPAGIDDIEGLNLVFSEAFTDRYRRDGLVGVRVPPLNPQVWRYALELAGDGAQVWRNSKGEVAAFNMVHQSGAEGWMGPLAVLPEFQGAGWGRRVVEAGIERLIAGNARTIGLETMPRTVDNIGFYSQLGFEPGHLTITVTAELERVARPKTDEDRQEPDFSALVEGCRSLTAEVLPGADYSAELILTRSLGIGDVSTVGRNDSFTGFALWHGAPLAAGRSSEELRVLKLVARDLSAADELVSGMALEGLRLGLERIALRCETRDRTLFRHLIQRGFRAHWTDLRMTLAGYGEPELRGGLALTNWEI